MGGGAMPGPIPGPMVDSSVLQERLTAEGKSLKNIYHSRSYAFGLVDGGNLFLEIDIGAVLVQCASLRSSVAIPNVLLPFFSPRSLFFFLLPPFLLCPFVTEDINASLSEVADR